MPFPFSIEGEFEVRIETPAKAQCVAEGIEHWLASLGATYLRWEGDCLRFHGHLAIKRDLNSFNGIGGGEIQLQRRVETVSITHRVFFQPFPTIFIGGALFFGVAVSGFGNPLRLLFLPLIALLAYAVWLMAGYSFQSSLRIASIRSLGDAAEAELDHLQNR